MEAFTTRNVKYVQIRGSWYRCGVNLERERERESKGKRESIEVPKDLERIAKEAAPHG